MADFLNKWFINYEKLEFTDSQDSYNVLVCLSNHDYEPEKILRSFLNFYERIELYLCVINVKNTVNRN